ncbi:MAG: RHS repeat-associated core domain-containing protein [Bacteroidota bacterium]
MAPDQGYILVYLSNESSTIAEVYFDDLEIEINEHPVIQTDDYYPFGGQFNSYQRITAKQNDFLFDGIERETELGLGWDLAEYRSYDPWIGRWLQIDPKASERESPYVGFGNMPNFYIDPLGDTVDTNNTADTNNQVQRNIDPSDDPTKPEHYRNPFNGFKELFHFFTFGAFEDVENISATETAPEKKSKVDGEGTHAFEDPDATTQDNAPEAKGGPGHVVVEPEAVEVDETLNRVTGFSGFLDIFSPNYQVVGEKLIITQDGDTSRAGVIEPGGGFTRVRSASRSDRDSVKENSIKLRKTKLRKSN